MAEIVVLPGIENCVADPLSRIKIIHLPFRFDLIELANEQDADEKLRRVFESFDHL